MTQICHMHARLCSINHLNNAEGELTSLCWHHLQIPHMATIAARQMNTAAEIRATSRANESAGEKGRSATMKKHVQNMQCTWASKLGLPPLCGIHNLNCALQLIRFKCYKKYISVLFLYISYQQFFFLARWDLTMINILQIYSFVITQHRKEWQYWLL